MLALLLCIACNTTSVLGDWDYSSRGSDVNLLKGTLGCQTINCMTCNVSLTAKYFQLIKEGPRKGMSSSSLKLVSFNTQGLQGNKKRKKVFHWL